MARKDVDWERVEVDYGVGLLSLREIASQHGITEGAIRKKAKEREWTRNIQNKIQQRADDLVRKAEVRSSVRKTSSQKEIEREVVEACATRQAEVRNSHRADITRMRALVISLLAECEAQTNDTRAFQELGELLRSDDERGQDKLNDIYQKSISLPTRIKGVKELCEAMKTLVAMEREAYGIKDASAGDEAMESLSDEALTAKLKAYVARAL